NTTIVRLELLKRRMQLESSSSPGNKPLGLAQSCLATRWIDAGESNHDVRVLCSEARDIFIGNRRPARQRFVDAERNTTDLARAVVIRDFLRLGFRIGR